MWLAHLVCSRLGFRQLPVRHVPFRPPRGSARAREKQEIADPGIDRRHTFDRKTRSRCSQPSRASAPCGVGLSRDNTGRCANPCSRSLELRQSANPVCHHPQQRFLRPLPLRLVIAHWLPLQLIALHPGTVEGEPRIRPGNEATEHSRSWESPNVAARAETQLHDRRLAC